MCRLPGAMGTQECRAPVESQRVLFASIRSHREGRRVGASVRALDAPETSGEFRLADQRSILNQPIWIECPLRCLRRSHDLYNGSIPDVNGVVSIIVCFYPKLN